MPPTVNVFITVSFVDAKMEEKAKQHQREMELIRKKTEEWWDLAQRQAEEIKETNKRLVNFTILTFYFLHKLAFEQIIYSLYAKLFAV